MEKENIIEKIFDDLLFQISKGNTIEQILKGSTILDLEQVKEWKSKFGYTFNIYSNDHFIDNKPHFHFDNKSKNIECKISFDGEIFESIGKNQIDKKTLKVLKDFLDTPGIENLLKAFWNNKNPDLKI
jgi:hypothetical protein